MTGNLCKVGFMNSAQSFLNKYFLIEKLKFKRKKLFDFLLVNNLRI